MVSRAGDEHANERLRVLYVGGMPRSGSTLTDLMLDQLPGHIAVGELYYLWEDGLVRNAPCSCGAAFDECEFWQAVGEHAYGGWRSIDLGRVHVLRKCVDSTSAIPRLIRSRSGTTFDHMCREYGDLMTSLYRAVIEVSGRHTVVDSSKRPSLAYVLRRTPSIDVRVAHVVRDPRGVAYSFRKHVAVDRGSGVPAEMPRSTVRKVGRRWVTVNALISALRLFGVPITRVRYEDLVTDPPRHLERILELEGIPATDDSFRFVQDAILQVRSTHAIAAGRVSRERGPITLSADDAWQAGLASKDRLLIATLTAPSRLWYGY